VLKFLSTERILDLYVIHKPFFGKSRSPSHITHKKKFVTQYVYTKESRWHGYQPAMKFWLNQRGNRINLAGSILSALTDVSQLHI